MGTVLEITLWGPERAPAQDALERLYALTARLEALFTRFDPDSELSRFNRGAGSGTQAIDAELAAILARSAAYSRLCRGSFDVTVGPLVELWQQAGRRGVVPTASELAAARARVGSETLRVSEGERAAELRAGSSVDLGGIAKGWAIDRMAEDLRSRDVTAALLSFGESSLWAQGAPPGEKGWRLLLRRADDGFAGVATLRDQALSVSGSLGQWTEIDGRRYGHVIDPRSGAPLTRRLQAVVVAPSGALAEALSKALLILGEREGIALLEAQGGVEGLLSDDAGGLWTTSGWRDAVDFEALGPAPAATRAR